jgi:hypothetical protein
VGSVAESGRLVGLQESTVYQFHSIYRHVSTMTPEVVRSLTLILHEPPMPIPPIPPMPPAAAPVDDGIAMPVPVGFMPDMAIEADVIVMPLIAIFACKIRAIVSWC